MNGYVSKQNGRRWDDTNLLAIQEYLKQFEKGNAWCTLSTVHTKYEKKIFLRRFPLSTFLAKTLRVNKIYNEKVSQKHLSFGVVVSLVTWV